MKKLLLISGSLVILLIITVATVIAFNAILSLGFDAPLATEDWDHVRKDRAAANRVPFDTRTWRDLWRECAFVQCQPFINPLDEFGADGSILPVASGPRRSRVIGCNETGTWTFHDLDVFGFNGNADNQYASRSKVVLIGDSFAYGACVQPGESIADRLKGEGIAVLNLGVGGHQPLGELAVLKEYMPPTDVLVWLFFEGNDFALEEKHHMFLRQYLAHGFTQHLARRVDESDTLFQRAIEARQSADGSASAYTQSVTSASWRERLGNRLRPTLSMIRYVRGQLSRPRIEFDRTFFAQILAEAQRFARDERSTSSFIFVYLPCYERFAWQPRAHPEAKKFEALRMAVKDIVEAQGWLLVDVARVFEQEPDPLSLFPFRTHAHYTPEGYAIVYKNIRLTLRHL